MGIWGKKSDEWFEDRIKIFKRYTLQSLLKQTNRAFLLWMSFRPEEERHPLLDELENYLKEVKMPTIMTFNGLMYWDDKFSTSFGERLMNIARIARQAWRERNARELLLISKLFDNKNKTLLDRLDVSLYELSKIQQFQDCNYIYLTRIDSDDMFHQEAIAEIQRIPPREGALIYDKGYVYNANTGEMATWNPKTNPPFHTIIFLGSQFYNPLEHLRTYKDFHSHEDIPRIFKVEKLSDNRYCVLVHGKHISTSWNHEFRGESVDPKLINDFI